MVLVFLNALHKPADALTVAKLALSFGVSGEGYVMLCSTYTLLGQSRKAVRACERALDLTKSKSPRLHTAITRVFVLAACHELGALQKVSFYSLVKRNTAKT
jgi:hypothetical protein